MMKIGLDEKIITQSKGRRLSGYADKRKATGVHDDLHARCMVMEQGGVQVALLSVAVVGLEQESNMRITAKASKITGIPVDNIIVHSTHTHSAPEIKGVYMKFVEKKCVEAVVDAWKNRFDGAIGSATAQVKECGVNRRYLDYGGLPVDEDIGILKIEDKKGKLRGVLFNYACHCTTLGALSTLVTEDWPYYAIKQIKDRSGSGVKAMFFNGACGDINPGYSAALSAVSADIPIRTWEKAESIGMKVARAVLGKLSSIKTKQDPVLNVSKSFVDLPCRKKFPVTLANAEKQVKSAEKELSRVQSVASSSRRLIERAKARVFLEKLLLNGSRDFYEGKLPKTMRAGLQSVRVGDSLITTFPGEIFSEIGMDVKHRSPASKTFVFELVNTGKAKGYMPAASSFSEGDYESYSSKYAENAGEVLAEASIDNMSKAWNIGGS